MVIKLKKEGAIWSVFVNGVQCAGRTTKQRASWAFQFYMAREQAIARREAGVLA